MIIDFAEYKVRITDKSVNDAFIKKIKDHRIADYVEEKVNKAFKKALYEELNIKPEDYTMCIEGDLRVIDNDSQILNNIKHKCDFCTHYDNSDLLYGIDRIYCMKKNDHITKEEYEKICSSDNGCKDFLLWARYLNTEK